MRTQKRGGEEMKMQNQWKSDMQPVMMTDDIAFVGGTPVSVHALIGRDGLILIDSGYPGMLSGVEENLRALGLHLGDVRFVVHSHGHIDHYGSTAEIVRRTGAQTLIGREDADIVDGRRDLSWAEELKLDRPEPFTPERTFSDGETLTLCGRTIRCVHAPGHTEGTYAFFIETTVNGAPMTAAMHGGVGLGSMQRWFLEKRGLPLSLREDFIAGAQRLMDERVDIVLGNHPQQNDTAGKTVRMNGAVNPFVDQSEWRRFLDSCARQVRSMLDEEERTLRHS